MARGGIYRTDVEKARKEIRSDLRQRDREVVALSGLPAELQTLKEEWAATIKANDTLREKLASVGDALTKERETRLATDRAAADDAARLKAFEEVIDALKKTGHSTEDGTEKSG